MAKTQAVNFRADSAFYQKTKDILADEKITVSDVLNAALRKIANRTVDAREFVSSDLQDTQYQVAFEDLKKEILIGQQEIAQGKVTSVADVRKEFGTRLNEVSSEILCAITDGKYDCIFIDENTNIYLLQGAQKISVGQVSRGTMEQIYFALRMAAAELMYEEEFPVILDETFAYYDERRLENTLRWLAENKRQIILFTCQRRELEMLRKLGIPYHVNG